MPNGERACTSLGNGRTETLYTERGTSRRSAICSQQQDVGIKMSATLDLYIGISASGRAGGHTEIPERTRCAAAYRHGGVGTTKRPKAVNRGRCDGRTAAIDRERSGN